MYSTITTALFILLGLPFTLMYNYYYTCMYMYMYIVYVLYHYHCLVHSPRTALQSIFKAIDQAILNNHYVGGLSHTWMTYYKAQLTDDGVSINEWYVIIVIHTCVYICTHYVHIHMYTYTHVFMYSM